jgi:stage III sporulation protein AD
VFGKILLAALAAALTCQLIRGKTPAVALLVSVSGILVLFGLLFPGLRAIWQQFQQLLQQSGLDSGLFSPLLKVLAVTQVTRISAELCRDAGERALGVQVELAGAVAALLCALPLAKRVLELITGAAV